MGVDFGLSNFFVFCIQGGVSSTVGDRSLSSVSCSLLTSQGCAVLVTGTIFRGISGMCGGSGYGAGGVAVSGLPRSHHPRVCLQVPWSWVILSLLELVRILIS